MLAVKDPVLKDFDCLVCSGRAPGLGEDQVVAFRASHGCDGEIAEPFVRYDCPVCGGDGCERCDWEGRLPLTRCPRALMRENPWAASTIEAWGYMQSGIPPVIGGVLDQSYQFMAACRVLDRCQARWQDDQMDKARRDAASKGGGAAAKGRRR